MFNVYRNGVYTPLSDEEATAAGAAWAEAERADRERPMSRDEVLERLFPGLIQERINGLEVDDAEALRMQEFYPQWAEGTAYPVGHRVRAGNGWLYRCLTAHTAQAGWDPVDAHSLWARVLIEDPDTVPDWVQPDSTNPYAKGDRVRHKGNTWVSTIDGNVWEPGVYGWEVTA